MKNKIISLLFSSLLLIGCNNNVSSSSNKNNDSSSTSKVESSENIASSSSSSDDESKYKEYFSTAIASLLFLNEGTEIKIESENFTTSFNLYYDLANDIYQFQMGDTYVTYIDECLYLDNNTNQYYYPIGELDTSFIFLFLGALEDVDVNEFNVEYIEEDIVMSYQNEDIIVKLYLYEDLLISLKKIEISTLNSKLSITPLEIEYHEIDKTKFVNLREELKFLEKYSEFLLKENLDIYLSMKYHDLTLVMNIEKRLFNLNLELNYKYLDDRFMIETNNNQIFYNNDLIEIEDLIYKLMENINPDLIVDFIEYFIKIVTSEITIEEDHIKFKSKDFEENIVFNLNDYMTVQFEYLNLYFEAKEVL